MKGFVTGGVYRHKSCLDIDIYVPKVMFQGSKYCDMKVIYLNRNWCRGEFVIDRSPERVRVLAKDFNRWERVR